MQQGEKKPLRIFCKGDENLNITLRDGILTLELADPTDKTQHWFQYFDTFNLIDDEGQRPFALVNRITEQAMAYRDKKLRLASYSREEGVDVSMLWTLGEKGTMEGGDGFAVVRALKNLDDTLNARQSNVRQGAVIEMYPSEPYSSNAVWKFEPILDQPSINTTAAV